MNLPRFLIGERSDHARIVSLNDNITKRHDPTSYFCVGELSRRSREGENGAQDSVMKPEMDGLRKAIFRVMKIAQD